MVVFPNCKVNLGLRVLRKRPDGYHDIETVMIPTGWCDVLEIVPAAGTETTLTVSGNKIDCPSDNNLVMKAYRAVGKVAPLPPVDIFLRKIVPDGAGLGGGSSDAAFTIIALNQLFQLGMSLEQMSEIAAEIGSDCPFFIYNRPMLCRGRGTEMTPVSVFPFNGSMLIAKPQVSVSTREAYSGISPRVPDNTLEELLHHPVGEWGNIGVHNDFEDSIFPLHPEIAQVKAVMESGGASYCSMTGSGAAVVGLFATDKLAEDARALLGGCVTFCGRIELN